MRHESVWTATAPVRERAGTTGSSARFDTIVVGAGVTGLTTALLLAREGQRVVVVERHEIGAGTTGRTTAKVTALHGLVYADLLDHLGPERARAYADANQAGVALVRELADPSRLRCDAIAAPAVTFAWSDGAVPQLEREVRAGQQLGLPLRLERSVALPFDVAGAVVLDDQLHLHPVKYSQGLAAELQALGGELREHEPVRSVHDEGDAVEVRTSHATLHADRVVLATLLPFLDIGGFFAKAEPVRSYALAAVIDSPIANGMYISTDDPVRSVRPLTIDGRPGLVAAGPSHKVGATSETSEYYDELEAWVRRTFAVEDVRFRWSAQDYVTADHVPYVGRSPRTEHVYVATGFKKWGLSNGSAAAMILRDLLTGHRNPWAETFDATRGPGLKEAIRLGKVNLDVAKELVSGLVRRFAASSFDDLAVGEGRVAELDGHKVGAYRDSADTVLAVSLTCTHLGCTVRWNEAERSWDCPCHGSRFDPEGNVLEGPALEPLTLTRHVRSLG